MKAHFAYLAVHKWSRVRYLFSWWLFGGLVLGFLVGFWLLVCLFFWSKVRRSYTQKLLLKSAETEVPKSETWGSLWHSGYSELLSADYMHQLGFNLHWEVSSCWFSSIFISHSQCTGLILNKEWIKVLPQRSRCFQCSCSQKMLDSVSEMRQGILRKDCCGKAEFLSLTWLLVEVRQSHWNFSAHE